MKHIALQASAGSGKTFMLSVRYLALFLGGANINDIVALTFTKKAVNEMKERITNVFLNLHEKKAELEELEKIINISQDEIIKIRDTKRKNFLEEELRIYTFDSFFSKILRLFATYEGLSVDYEQTNFIKLNDEFLKSLTRDEALEIVKNLKNLNMNLDNFLSWLYNLYLNYTGEYELNVVNDIDLMKIYNDIKYDLMSYNDKKITEWLNEICDIDSLLNSKIYGKKTTEKAMNNSDVFKNAYEKLIKAISHHYAYLEYQQLKLCFKYLDKFVNIAKQYHQKNNILSFGDVALYVHKILQNNDLKDLFYFRLNSNLNHLLIDEFQDTSIIQYEIIKPIVEEIVSGIGIDNRLKSFFYVGDKKQSIYTFRGAKQEVFDLFYKNPSLNITLKNLDTNYRSKIAIVEFVNKNFKEIYPNGVYTNQLVASKEQGRVSKIISDDYLVDTYKKIVSLLKNGVKLEDICILVRENKYLNFLSEFLSSKGLDINTNNNITLVEKISVRVLIEFAKYCIFKDYAYLYFVKSVLGIEYDIIKIDITKPPASVYNDIINHLGIKKDEFILEFLNDVSNAPNFLTTLYEFSDSLSNATSSKGINIMTVHKSKGLQFEHVICIHNDKSTVNDVGLKIEYNFDKAKWYGFIKSKKDIVQLRCMVDSDYTKKIESYENTLKLDEINNYYVAYTRAITSLCIIKTEKSGLSEIDYNSLESEILDDNLLEYNYEKTAIQESYKKYDFDTNIPLQNIKNKYFSSDEIILGEAFHYFCELNDFKYSNFDECFKLVIFKFPKVNVDKLKDMCNKFINYDELKQLLNGFDIIKEYNFKHKFEVCRIDLLAMNDNEILIIDYKSSCFRMEYKKQLDKYEEFIKSIYKNKIIKKVVIFYENNEFNLKYI
ncbi:UvrD-helicase domain-containing protein [Campylobacter sp. MG1]|uniref:UvrD-helicase domain-containing protein n=1 Tax=Campylobacter sp. MG1 TaxID=2976332 RepID=UPI00226CE479|nr:UvrD-helicase domain-containing protein [Campylobacter sp. MG1]